MFLTKFGSVKRWQLLGKVVGVAKNREAGSSRAQGGWYRQVRVIHPDVVTWKTFEDPWSFHDFFRQDNIIWLEWLIKQNMLNGKDNSFRCIHMYGRADNGINISQYCFIFQSLFITHDIALFR